MHIHLDLTGGIAGDMFSAAMLDAFPELEKPLLLMLEQLQLGSKVKVEVKAKQDKGLNGKLFNVILMKEHHHCSHSHRSWKEIKRYLEDIVIDECVKKNALGIFSLLAKAESEVHLMSIEDVHFHEVGAWDCIIDIISASWLICNSKVSTWSISSIPWGGGVVKCEHGVLPVPAPATLKLLKDFDFHDDQEKGERVTPTGAAIISWISPKKEVVTGKFLHAGQGFGVREFESRPNLLRACVFETIVTTRNQTISAIQCDIDDMTGEMLAIARENIRRRDGVLEIMETISQGKKNRMISTLTVLCLPFNLPEVIQSIFEQTSTIGLRYWSCERMVLDRNEYQIIHDKKSYSVKTVTRPNGTKTTKLEASHLSDRALDYSQRQTIKAIIEHEECKHVEK